MAARTASLSRSFLSTARASSFRSSPPLPRLRPPPLSAPRPPRSRPSFANPRLAGVLGCTQSLLPLHSVVAASRLTSHLSVDSRACCELSQGMTKMGDARMEIGHHWDAGENDVTSSTLVLE